MIRRTLPVVGDLPAFRADRLGFFTQLAHSQGDVARFRIGPYHAWSFAHPDLVGEVLVSNAAAFHKGPVLQRSRLVLGDGLLTSEGERHRADRRALQHAFHPQRIVGHAGAMIARADAAADRWQAGVGFDLHAEMVRVTLATAGEALLGADVDRDVPTVEHAIDDLLRAYALAFVPFGWRLQHVPIGPARRLQRGRHRLHTLLDRIIDERRRDGIDRGDLLSSLVFTSGLDDERIREQAVTMLLAGHETTANALTFSFHLLATDPLLDARVVDELDRVLGGRLPVADDLDHLEVCRGVVAEALRLFPPSWAISREARHDQPIGEVTVRAGEVVVLSPWVVHRDPRWWPEPTRPDPDRHAAEVARSRPRWAFFPFGAGARRCIGEGFAWTEATLALATIRRRWRLQQRVGPAPVLDPLITLRPRGGAPMVPEPA
jgi:cytochrome P450